MNMMRLMIALLVAVLSAGMVSAADQWLHVKIDSNDADGEAVRVNIPLSLVEKVLPMIESEEMSHGVIRIDDAEMEGIDLKELLLALKETEDTNFVTVQSNNETVRVAKEGEFFIVRVEEDNERVNIKMPMSVIDAVAEGASDDGLDLSALIRALGEYQGGDLITVESDEEQIRIWIDSSNSIAD